MCIELVSWDQNGEMKLLLEVGEAYSTWHNWAVAVPPVLQVPSHTDTP